MAIKIAFSNEKGGIGKTTAAVNVARQLGLRGYRTLLVDLDGQCNASSSLGFIKDRKPTVADLIYDTVSGREIHYEEYLRTSSDMNHVDYIPASQMLFSTVAHLGCSENSSYVLREIFSNPLYEQYDFILFDCRTQLDLLVQNALNACDYVLIPEMPTFYGFDGLNDFLGNLERLQASSNPNLQVLGILYNNKPARSEIADNAISSAREIYGNLVLKTVINNAPAQAEIAASGQNRNGSFRDGFSAATEELLHIIEAHHALPSVR